MIDKLQALAKSIENKCHPQGPRRDTFAQLCNLELTKFEHDYSLDQLDTELSMWLETADLPEQLYVYNDFGQPPVTIFNNGQFTLDLYFWMSMDTSIHSHSFTGAFKVLFGKSLHEVYEIKPNETFAPDVMSTHIKCVQKKILNQGDSHKILPGDLFNHCVVHLEEPTVTLCIRTINDTENKQWHHFPNGLSIEKRAQDQKIIKNLYYYQYLFKRDKEKAFSFVHKMIDNFEISVIMNLFEQVTIEGMGLEEDAIDLFANMVINKYGETNWYKLYEEAFVESENYLQEECLTSSEVFIQHALNFNYTRDEALKLLFDIQNCPPNEVQSLQLSNLT